MFLDNLVILSIDRVKTQYACSSVNVKLRKPYLKFFHQGAKFNKEISLEILQFIVI